MSLPSQHQWPSIERFFDQFFTPASLEDKGNMLSPRVDITDKGDALEIIADLPGVKKEDVRVQVYNGVLSIEAQTQSEKTTEQDKVIRKERYSGHFSRQFNLGPNIGEHDIVAQFSDGVLKLTVPKLAHKAPEARQISIK
ncbi:MULTISPECIES: Hsp20/alpha crystallin family protein [Shewanella]|uniref:Hsp20/alpha crystallin family protein n=2 Tax=Shewanella TaxID=22 RepID=A0A974XI19_9GAMM|nr:MULTISPECIES: Hsp20/alpha crystallin family protein [Shewanella]QSX28792.1 Hsp20/alpha crystallin family protein [Shewanella cyperi]QSX35909.1 Hsp20/alpha crystallin family protein [Shewanella sedimentimangrovi]QSX39531.1 Hsp20/alpha crystallin family protein [Shewanella cyperi]